MLLDISPAVLALVLTALLLALVPNLWSIWHASFSAFSRPGEKACWLLAAVILPILGGLLYIFWGKKRARSI